MLYEVITPEAWRVLEYPRLREILASFALSAPGRRLIEALTPELSPQEVARSLGEVSEARRLLEQQRSIPVSGSEELQPLLARLQTPGAQAEARITSYNVCYTKLLRNSISALR